MRDRGTLIANVLVITLFATKLNVTGFVVAVAPRPAHEVVAGVRVAVTVTEAPWLYCGRSGFLGHRAVRPRVERERVRVDGEVRRHRTVPRDRQHQRVRGRGAVSPLHDTK